MTPQDPDPTIGDPNFPNGDSYDKIVEAQRKYEQSPKGKLSKKKYFNSEKGRKALKRYFNSQKGAEAQLRYALSDKGKKVRSKVLTKQQVLRICADWLAANPGKTAADFFEQIVQQGGSNGSTDSTNPQGQ